MTRTTDATTTGAPMLLQRWRSVSVDTVWRRPGDWYTPAVEAVADALATGRDTAPAAFHLGQERSAAGVGITEAIDDVAVLYRAAGFDSAPIHTIRALCEGWTAGDPPTLNVPTMTDAESGLGTAEYLSHRLAELYGTAQRTGTSVHDTHALVMVDVSVEGGNPWQRIARNGAVGAALTSAYGEGHPMARMGDGLYAVLVERGEALGQGIAALRERLAQQAEVLKSSDFMRQPPRVWIESLPDSRQYATALVDSLKR